MLKQTTSNSFLELALALFIVISGAAAQSPSLPSEKKEQLTVSAKLKSQSYCLQKNMSARSTARIGSAEFHIKIHIRNISDHDVILCKACVASDVPQFWTISPDGGVGERINPEIADRFGWKKVSNPRRPDDNYVILKPGQDFESDIPTLAFVNLEPKSTQDARGLMFQGKYYLRADVSTWWQDQADTEKLRLKWTKYGELWVDGIEPPLIRVDIAFPENPPMCSE